MEDRTLLSTFLVTNTNDSGSGSLRQAILNINAATSSGSVIDFAIAGVGVQVINPLSALPPIDKSVLVDGWSQPGYSGLPLIELSGSKAGDADGLEVEASSVVIRGLDVNGFRQGAGIELQGASATNDWIYGDFVGTDPTGTTAKPNDVGVEIQAGATDNLVGTNGDGVGDSSERGLISGNSVAGVFIDGQGSNGNVVAGNLIGTTISGDTALPNGTSQIDDYQYNLIGGGVVIQGAADNLIGTNGLSADDPGERNVISGNAYDGVDVVGASAIGNVVAGNFIGTDATGALPLGNARNGVLVADSASSTIIGVNPTGGGTMSDEGNVISGNDHDGVAISNTFDNLVAGGMIGTDVSGTVSLANAADGIEIASSYGTTIGGTTSGAGALISGNGNDGIQIDGDEPSGNLIAGDLIGSDLSGLVDIGNGHGGVELDAGSTDNTIGGATTGAGNLITGNGGPGVFIIGGTSVDNSIIANRIFGNSGQAIDLGDDGVTGNGSGPRTGPDDLQNYPVIVATAGGQLEGWLGGSEPNGTYRIDVYASADFGPGGAGEADDFLSDFEVTTNANGQATFVVPVTPPAGLRVITGTATDPAGNTSELSDLRATSLVVQAPIVRDSNGQPLVFSAASTDGLILQDPGATPLDPLWDLTLSVSTGSLALSGTAGLIGSGDKTGTLSYSGTLSALNAALSGLTYSPPAGFAGNATLSLSASSEGASPVASSLTIASGIYVVTTAADSGAGSLRAAIVDADATPGAAIIDFDIPGSGVQTIWTASPLPTITNSVLIDGFTQPGYASTPLVEIDGENAGQCDGLTITGPATTVRGLEVDGFAAGAGIAISGAAATGDTITADVIGTDPTGSLALSNAFGVRITNGASHNLVGGINAQAGNLIAFNTGPGVSVEGNTSVGNQITANRIFGDGGPAIDLGDDGVSYDSTSARVGPNNLQDFPIIVPILGGGYQGWLPGGVANTTYLVDFFASAAYGAGGSGEAQNYLGSLDVTTDANGQAFFDLPFTAPVGAPYITATATDPHGDTSEVSALRRTSIQAPPGWVVPVAGQPLFPPASTDSLIVEDPDAGLLDPAWDFTVSVPAGTLYVPSLAGLTGTGNGTGILQYAGSLSAVNAALASVVYTPPPGPVSELNGLVISVGAQSAGAVDVSAQVPLSDGVFTVINTADSGPGSLRQAILDAQTAPGVATVDFDILGSGIQTICTASALPVINKGLLIDGFSQPGYAGTPLIEIDGAGAGSSDGLTLTSSGAIIRGLVIDGFLDGAAILIDGPEASNNAIYDNELGTNAIDPTADGNLYGVEIVNGAHNNDIGTNGVAATPSPAPNQISGNSAGGVLLSGDSIDDSHGFTASRAELTLNGSATIQGDQLQLTDSENSQTSSVFTSQEVDVSQFDSQFTFQDSSAPIVEAFTFTMQDQGPTALGSYLGYVGLQHGLTVDFVITANGEVAVGLIPDGAAPPLGGLINLTGHGMNLSPGDALQANLSYDGQGLTVNVTDLMTGASATGVYSVNIPSVVGSPTAYVGFTAGTDDSALSEYSESGPFQDILSWSYSTSAAGVIGNQVVNNTIANNGGPGVALVGDDLLANAIRANTISGNIGPAIDEGGDGANGFPVSPVIIATGSGALAGWLAASQLDATYTIDFFASTSYAEDGTGEAQDYLGSIEVTTNDQGQAVFDVPFTPPADLPIVTATATDMLGDTSEVSGLRTAKIAAPGAGFRFDPGQPLDFSGSPATNLALEDPDAGPLATTWTLTLSVPVGTLLYPTNNETLSFVSGNGTGTLQLQGSVSALDEALESLTFTPPSGFHGNSTLSVVATAAGAQPAQAQFNLTDGIFVVTTTADSGPGSLRQAIIDSNVADNGSNTIAFALPGSGVQTITLATPLPQATTPTLIDGTTQPGFVGTPLVALSGNWPGAGGDINVVGSLLSVRGLVVTAYAFGTDSLPESLTMVSSAIVSSSDHPDLYPIDLTVEGTLAAQVQSTGLTTSLTLLDSQMNVLVRCAGPASSDAGPLIDQLLPAGTYFLSVSIAAGSGDYAVNTEFTPTSQLSPVIPYVGYAELRSTYQGDFTGSGATDLLIDDFYFDDLPGSDFPPDNNLVLLMGNGDGSYQSTVYVIGEFAGADELVTGDFAGNGRLDIALADGSQVYVLLNNGNGTFKSPEIYQVAPAGDYLESLVAGDFTDDGKLDLAASSDEGIDVLLGNGNGTFQPPIVTPTPVGLNAVELAVADLNGDGKDDLKAIDGTGDELSENDDTTVYLSNGDGTFTAQPTVAAPTAPAPSSLLVATGDFTGSGRTDVAEESNGIITILLSDGEGHFDAGQQITVGPIASLSAADFNGDGRLDLITNLGVLLGYGDGTFQTTFTPLHAAIVVPSLAEFDALLPGLKANSFQTADFTGDGTVDAAVLGTYDFAPGLFIFLGNADGGFTYSQTIRLHDVSLSAGDLFATGALVIGDLTGDGKLDIAVLAYNPDYEYASNYTPVLDPTDVLWLFQGDGAGTFTPAGSEPLYGLDNGAPVSSALLADLDGNGQLDLVVWGSAGLYVLPGYGAGAFGFAQTINPETSFSSVCVGDVVGDGRLDLILVGDDTATALLNDGDGSFLAPSQLILNSQDTPLVADVNGDGIDDVLVVDGNGDILYREGNPDAPGSFLPPVIINTGFPSRDIAWVPDTLEGPLLASVDARDNAVSLYAIRDGVFVRVGSLSTGQIPAQIIAADLEGNGWDSLVVRNAGDGTLSVFLNNGLGSSATGFDSPFLPPSTITVGTGVADVQAIDTTGDGLPDLVVTDSLSGQLSVLLNLGNGTFAPPVPYRAGVSPDDYDNSSSAVEITSEESTAGVAGGSLTPGSPLSLVAADPGTGTLALLAGAGGGGFAYPTVLLSQSNLSVVRAADFNDDGVMDLAVLDSQGVTVLLGDGKGGFLPPVTYSAGLDPTGLTIADVNADDKPDLIVGNAYGDILVLLNLGNGTFAPYQNADQAVTLAVADLTGNGQKDVIYADQSLDRVVVDYGGGGTSVLGDQSSGLLSPGAVMLADLNGDGIPDLIVANSGSNNVLVYPGLGNGQFGPAVNDGHGFFTGTDPIGLYVADLTGNGIPDLVVANAGSNDVSVLLGEGTGSDWTMVAGPRIKTDAGPVAVAVGNFLGTGQLDLAVANQEANNVEVFPSVGNGFFNDAAPSTYAVGQAPSGLFLGNFTGSGPSIATLNSGSNTISLIGQSGVIQTIDAGGLRPVSGFAGDFLSNGFTDLVVGDNGDGRFALFTGGPNGLSLSQTITDADVPSPTSLTFAGISDGVLSFYASTAGVESATLLAFNLEEEASASGSGSITGEGLAPGTEQSAGSVLAAATTGLFQQVAQFLNLNGSALDLVAPLFTVSVIGGELDGSSTGGGGVALLANFAPVSVAATAGQALRLHDDGPGDKAAQETQSQAPDSQPDGPVVRDASPLPLWERISMGLDNAWEQMRSAVIEKGGARPVVVNPVNDAPASPGQPDPVRGRSTEDTAPGQLHSTGESASRAEVTGLAIEEILTERDAAVRFVPAPSGGWDEVIAIHHERAHSPFLAATAIASAAILGTYVELERLGRSRPRKSRAAIAKSGHLRPK